MLIKTFPHVHKLSGNKRVLWQSRRAVDDQQTNKTPSVPASSPLNKLLIQTLALD